MQLLLESNNTKCEDKRWYETGKIEEREEEGFNGNEKKRHFATIIKISYWRQLCRQKKIQLGCKNLDLLVMDPQIIWKFSMVQLCDCRSHVDKKIKW